MGTFSSTNFCSFKSIAVKNVLNKREKMWLSKARSERKFALELWYIKYQMTSQVSFNCACVPGWERPGVANAGESARKGWTICCCGNIPNTVGDSCDAGCTNDWEPINWANGDTGLLGYSCDIGTGTNSCLFGLLYSLGLFLKSCFKNVSGCRSSLRENLWFLVIFIKSECVGIANFWSLRAPWLLFINLLLESWLLIDITTFGFLLHDTRLFASLWQRIGALLFVCWACGVI